MEVASSALGVAREAWKWYSGAGYAAPVLAGRAKAETVLGPEWSAETVGLAVALACAALTLFLYFACVRPMTQVASWVGKIAFVLGIPAYAGYLAWTVPLPFPSA